MALQPAENQVGAQEMSQAASLPENIPFANERTIVRCQYDIPIGKRTIVERQQDVSEAVNSLQTSVKALQMNIFNL